MDDEAYKQKINLIYEEHLSSIGVTDLLESICGQAGKVYDEIFRFNLDVGYWNDPDKFDHTLSYFIAGEIKAKVKNLNLIKISEKSLARKITNQILKTFKFPRAVELSPQDYHPDDWAAANYEEGLRRQGYDLYGNPLYKLPKTLLEQVEESFLFVSANFQDIGDYIQDRITFRKQEISIVIDNSKTIGSVQNSNVIQGEGISLTIKNYNVTFNNIKEDNVQELKDIFKLLNSLEEQVQSLLIKNRAEDATKICRELRDLTEQISFLSDKVERNLSQITDYYILRKSLKTD